MKQFYCMPDSPVVQTKAGKLRGFFYDGIYNFRGIQYGVAERFMAPRDVEKWDGIKDALVWGYTAPVPSNYMIGDDFTVPHRFWPQSEDCLYLNVWSPELSLDAKKPVMVWIHGGGYFNGSSMEMIAYDGDNLSKFGDVVVVSVNHRLNHLGFMDLSAFGERYANSGNRGLEDLVQALKWVQENIAGFGGDPDNVTIFGQSGGGGKVTNLLQIPAANGLFHKAVIQSGVMGGLGRRSVDSKVLAEKMLEILGGDEISLLETAPLTDLQKAYNLASQELVGPMGGFGGCGPTPNDWYLGDPLSVGFTEHAATIPIMVGTVVAEMGYPGKLPVRDTIGEAETRRLLADEYGEENVDDFIRAFHAAYPDKPAVYALYLSDRLRVLEFCKKKAEMNAAPAYNYNFALVFPFNGGTPAWHCAEIPFVFHNAEKLPLYHIDGGVTETVEQTTCSAWVNFARTGNPSGGAVGEWQAFEADKEYTYIFDEVSVCKTGYDRELMELVSKHQKPRRFF